VGDLLRGYCLFLLDAGAPEEAESLAREAVEIQSRLDAKNATPLAQAEVALGLCLRNQGRLDAARLELSRAVRRLEEHLGEAAAETLEARRHLEALDGMISGASAPDEAH
jgi:tetratricopeptide (TPR) repeat protein